MSGIFRPAPADAPQVHVEGLPTLRCATCDTGVQIAPMWRLAEHVARTIDVKLATAVAQATANDPAQADAYQRLRNAAVRVQFGAQAPVADGADGGGLFDVTPFETLNDSLDQLFVADPVKARLLDFVQRVKDRARIAEALGPRLRRKVDRNVLCLTGAPGVGKSLMARLVARDLGRALALVELAELESPEVGEAQRRLRRLFALARKHGWVIFIDECDALIDARIQARNGHEKHLNSIRDVFINELNRFAGVLVLASNLRDSFDPAIARRMVEVQVPRPDESVLRGAIPALLREVALERPADARWVEKLVLRIALHEREHGNPVRPFTIAELEAVIEQAVNRAARLRSEGPVAVTREVVEAALEEHLFTMRPTPTPASPSEVKATAAESMGQLLVASARSHVRRIAEAERGRPNQSAREEAYRPAAEATMADLLAGYGELAAEVMDLAQALAASAPEEILARLRQVHAANAVRTSQVGRTRKREARN